jgi:hypothetical protein
MARKSAQTDTTIGPIFQVRDLTAGVNLRPTATTIQPNQARRLVNALISNIGELGIYPGFVSFLTSSLGARRAQGAKRIYLSGSTFTLMADNGNIYKPSDAGVVGGTVLTGRDASNPIDFVYDRDIVAVFDGTNVPKKSKDGTTWTQLGITQPAAPVLTAPVASGSLINGHQYEVSYAYYDDTLNQTSNATNTSTITLATPNLTIRVATTASVATDVDKIKIYVRDVTAGDSVRRLAATITNSTTTTDITANTWDGQEEAPTDHNVSVAMSFGVVWKNRWWGRDATVKNRLRFTQIFQNQSWPATFFVDIPFERGEDITLLVPLGDILVVFGYTKFYLIIGQTSLDFEVRPALGAQTGAFGFRAGDAVESGIAHASPQGVYLFNGASDELLSYPIDTAWQAMVQKASADELSKLPMTYHKLTKELRAAVPYLYPTGGRGEWILDLNRTKAGDQQGGQSGPAWFATTRTVGGYLQWDGNEATTGNQGRIFSWDATTARLYEERTGTTANGADITMEYDGYMLPFGIQIARLIDSYLEYQPAQGTLTVDLKVDGRLMGSQSFDLGGSLPRYGTARYGVDRYSGAADRSMLPIMWPLEAEGHSAQFFIKYTGHDTPKFYTYGHNAFEEPVPRGI